MNTYLVVAGNRKDILDLSFALDSTHQQGTSEFMKGLMYFVGVEPVTRCYR